VRIDQWLWAVRLYKSRSLAVAAIKSGAVEVNETTPKPAREVQTGDVIRARTGDLTRVYRVLGFPAARVGAPLVPQFAEDLAPPPPPGTRPAPTEPVIGFRPRGAGRPTKRERRQIEDFLN
jgi:ribosome-associated heat shock protein Hsp15